MKKGIVLTLISVILSASTAMAFDLKDALNKLGNSDNSSATDAIGNVIGNLLSSDNIELQSLVGTWKYSAPAVSFKSDNLLKKAGGAAASTAITDKLAPIYQKVGFDRMQLTVADDSTFSMKVRTVTLKGTIEKVTDANSSANFIFNFKVAGKLNVGKMDTYVVKSATGKLSVMFDVSKLITLVEKISAYTSNTTLKSVSSMLSGYDGLCSGFELEQIK